MYVNNSSLQLRTDRAKREEEEAKKYAKGEVLCRWHFFDQEWKKEISRTDLLRFALIRADDVTIINDYHRKEKNIQRVCKGCSRTDRLFSPLASRIDNTEVKVHLSCMYSKLSHVRREKKRERKERMKQTHHRYYHSWAKRKIRNQGLSISQTRNCFDFRLWMSMRWKLSGSNEYGIEIERCFLVILCFICYANRRTTKKHSDVRHRDRMVNFAIANHSDILLASRERERIETALDLHPSCKSSK